MKGFKRPSTKEAIDRNSSISKLSEGTDGISSQFSTAYPIKTPISQSYKVAVLARSEMKESGQLSQTPIKTDPGSTVGFSSSTHNTTAYNKTFGDTAFRKSKYAKSTNGGEQSYITRSSFYKDQDLSETLMMRSQSYSKIQCPH